MCNTGFGDGRARPSVHALTLLESWVPFSPESQALSYDCTPASGMCHAEQQHWHGGCRSHQTMVRSHLFLKAGLFQAVGCFAHKQGPGPVPFIMRDGDCEHLAICVLKAQAHPQGAIPVTRQADSHFKGGHWQIAGTLQQSRE